ncbi:MAG: glycoside hydrolase family 3 protein [Desulfomonile tiedjei]|uniref:beta-N-acetylhexosaminidase n=1 Tax=Desulfomonile tiedjei TaxID=2358 RepID=A0A9D6VA66_9BACT|nr:glycoside hydrolase family 3 protein [Desulfomonile tiedjei]
MKPLLAVLKLSVASALAFLALDWRSPFLAVIRPWALLGFIALPLALIVAERWALRTSRPRGCVLRVLSALTLILAVLALATTLTLEARFHWVRHQVIHADPDRLERLGRHLIVGYRDLAEVRELVKLRAIAGIFISTRNVLGKSADEVRQEIRSLQNQRKEQGLLSLWIATDQEGGVVSRLSPPLTRLPPISEIVQRYSDISQREQAVREFAGTQGRELAEVGVNLNFAPVVDLNFQVINSNDRFTRIFQRAISGDPGVVTQVAAWYCATLEEAGVRSTLKHFPGLGRVFEDTHLNHANLTTSIDELTKTDWVPFRVLMHQSGAFTMLGHVRLTAIDSERPVSISPPVIAGVLRRDWKHDGVLITDDFSMLAVFRSSAGIDNGSIDALNAGVDVILVSWDSDQYYRVMYALLNADRQGTVDREILQRSDKRLERAIRGIQH